MTKSLYPRLYATIWSVAQIVTRGQELPLLSSLEKSQYFPLERLQELQFSRLVELINYAYQNVPFYKERFQNLGMSPRDIRSVKDYSQIPILTRKDLQDNLPSLQSTASRPGKYINYTGGSTGNPVTFYQDKLFHDYYKASIIRLRRWYGFDRGDKVAYIWGAERDIPRWSRLERLQTLLKRQKWLNAFRMTDDQIRIFMFELREWHPTFIIGYASALHALAKYMLRNGISGIRPLAIESSAEKLWDYQRLDIEKAFGAPVMNVYGSREMSPIAAQCMEREGLHTMAETRFVQITDQSGLPLDNGQIGSVVLTDLTNYSMPLIRYANGDMASWHGEYCSCGRTLPMLSQIQGRTSDLILTKSGTTIHGEFFTHLFYGQPVAQFQVRQIAIDRLIILIRPASGFSDQLFPDIKHKIDEFSEGAFEVDFRIVDEIPLTSSGKYRFTVSELQQVIP